MEKSQDAHVDKTAEKYATDHVDNAAPTSEYEGSHEGAGEITNPLASKTKDELISDVEAFCNEHDMVDRLETFKKGALVARAPHAPRAIPELIPEDHEVLRVEREHRWRHPKALYFTVFMTSIGAAIQGWDQTGSFSCQHIRHVDRKIFKLPDMLPSPEPNQIFRYFTR